MASFKPKQFGLIVKKKPGVPDTTKTVKPLLKKSVFGDDDSDEDITKVETAKEARQRVNAELVKKSASKQVEQSLDAVLGDDPNAFAYDDVYDDMQATKAQAMGEKTRDRKAAKAKPKYISALLEKSNERKLEYERFVERKVQKERDAEGDEFEGKEKFITSAYKKKLEERRQAEEEEKRKAAQEAKDDVRNQTDLSGFYRNLLTSNVAMGADAKDAEDKPTTTKALPSDADTMGSGDAAQESASTAGRAEPIKHNHGRNGTHPSRGDASTRSASPRDSERSRARTHDSGRSHHGSRNRSRERRRSRSRSRSRSRGRDRRSDRDSRSDRSHREHGDSRDRDSGDRSGRGTRSADRGDKINSTSKDKTTTTDAGPTTSHSEAQIAAEKAKAVMTSKRNTKDRIAMARAKALARKQRGTKKAEVGMEEK